MKLLRHRQGQSIIEYSILMGIVALSLSLFFTFIRAATAHRLKGGADTFGHGLIFRP